jgi:hypothetical protein
MGRAAAFDPFTPGNLGKGEQREKASRPVVDDVTSAPRRLSQVAAAMTSARLLAITASSTAYLASSVADSANTTAS